MPGQLWPLLCTDLAMRGNGTPSTHFDPPLDYLFPPLLPAAGCRPPFEPFGDECLHLKEVGMEWKKARSFCRTLRADLYVPTVKQGFEIHPGSRQMSDPHPPVFVFLEGKRKARSSCKYSKPVVHLNPGAILYSTSPLPPPVIFRSPQLVPPTPFLFGRSAYDSLTFLTPPLHSLRKWPAGATDGVKSYACASEQSCSWGRHVLQPSAVFCARRAPMRNGSGEGGCGPGSALTTLAPTLCKMLDKSNSHTNGT